MSQTESAMAKLVSAVQASIGDFLAADQSFSSDGKNPVFGKVVQALAILGVVCTTRTVFKHSKKLAKYCLVSPASLSADTLRSRYGSPAWVVVLNTADQLGNAYCQTLASFGFDLILVGPPIDRERMDAQANSLHERFQVRTRVIIVDYQNFAELSHQENAYAEIESALGDADVCMLVNNQSYTVPFDFARQDLMA